MTLEDGRIPDPGRHSRSALQREDAIEMYYNMAITPLMNFTSDLQIVDSTLNKAINPTMGKLTGIDSVVVAEARLRIRF